jgi:hypothetical protein
MDEQHKVHRVSESVHDALNAIRAGRFVIVLDDESRENEGDLVIAAEHATTSTYGHLAHGSEQLDAPSARRLAVERRGGETGTQ